jgi:antitoxin component YwqK of YwqJK toxin-antitoxin module
MLFRATACLILASSISLPDISAQQMTGSPGAFYALVSGDLTGLKKPAIGMHALSYGNLYSQEMPQAGDSVTKGFFPSGNTEWEHVYERGTGRLREERRFRDNDRHEMVSSNVPGDTRRSYNITYDSTGINEISWVENGIPLNRNFKRTVDAQGRTIRETRYFRGSEEYDYAFTYDAQGRKLEERHFSGGFHTDTYLYKYNLTGQLVQEIRQKPGMVTDLMMTYQYDSHNRIVRTDYFRNRDSMFDEYTLTRYDAAGNKIEEATFYADGRVDNHRFFEYDKWGGLIKKSWTNPVTFDERIAYDASGNAVRQASLQEVHQRLFVGGLLMRDSIFTGGGLADVHTYQYGQRKRLVSDSNKQCRTLYFYGNCAGPDSVVVIGPTSYRQKTTFAYSNRCLLTEKKTVFERHYFDFEHGKPGRPPVPEIFRYNYDSKGRLISEMKVDEKDSGLFEIRWSYASGGAKTGGLYMAGQPAATVGYRADGLIEYFSKDRGGGSQETHRFNYEWDKQGNWIRRDEAITGRYGWTEHALALRYIDYE